MRTRVVPVILFLLLSMRVVDGAALTLGTAVGMAVDHNFDLAEKRLRAAAPALQEQIERAAFRWKVRPFFGVETSEDEVALSRVGSRVERQLGGGTLLQARGEWIVREEGSDEQAVDLTLEQPLFRRQGELWSMRGVAGAVYQRRVAEWSLHRETEALILRVVELYTDVLRQERRVEDERGALARAGELARLLELRERQGRANGVEVLEMRLLRQEAEQRLRRAEERVLRSRGDLAELLGISREQLPDLEAAEVPEVPARTRSEWLEVARGRRTEYAQALAAYDEARRQVEVQRRELYPDVRLLGRWRPVAEGGEEGAWFAGVTGGQELDFDLTRMRVEREELQARAALMAVTSLELRLSREMRQAEDRHRFAAEELALAEGRGRVAAERLRLARSLYALGRVDATQVRQAEEAGVRAEAEEVDARVEAVRAAYGFLHSAGLLLGGE